MGFKERGAEERVRKRELYLCNTMAMVLKYSSNKTLVPTCFFHVN
jgi:hypothetical protein